MLTDRVSIGTPLAGVAVNAIFDATHVTGTSGCNGYSRSYTTDGARMNIVNDGVSTLIACPGAAGKVEPAYLARLDQVGRYRISGTTLTLSTRVGQAAPRVPSVDRIARARGRVERDQRLHRRRDLVAGAGQRARRSSSPATARRGTAAATPSTGR